MDPFGISHFVLYREVVLSLEVKITSIIEKVYYTSKCVIYSECLYIII